MNLFKYSIYGNKYVGNLYPSKYSKYDEELPKDMQQLYIHHGLSCPPFFDSTAVAISSAKLQFSCCLFELE